MSSIFKDCAFSAIDDFVKRETQLRDKRKIQSSIHYWKVVAKAENKFIAQTDFSIALQTDFPEELLVFTESQKEKLDEIADYIESPEEFSVHLQLLAKVLSDFEESESLSDPIAQVTLKNYDYLKLKLKAKYPQVYAHYRRRIANFKQKKTEKQSRPPCPECKGTHVMSQGSNWKCRDCGRSFVKNPRRRKK